MQNVVGTPPSTISKRDVKTELTLAQLVQDQMKCLEKLHNFFDDIDSKMCEANNVTTNNTNCWNGREMGR